MTLVILFPYHSTRPSESRISAAYADHHFPLIVHSPATSDTIIVAQYRVQNTEIAATKKTNTPREDARCTKIFTVCFTAFSSGINREKWRKIAHLPLKNWRDATATGSQVPPRSVLAVSDGPTNAAEACLRKDWNGVVLWSRRELSWEKSSLRKNCMRLLRRNGLFRMGARFVATNGSTQLNATWLNTSYLSKPETKWYPLYAGKYRITILNSMKILFLELLNI